MSRPKPGELDPPGAPPQRLVGWLACVALAMALAPVITVLHELAHYAAGLAFDFPGLELHLTSVTDTAGAAGFPDWQRGVKSAAGPLVNWLFVGAACLAARRWPAAVWAPVVGLTAAIAPGLDSGAWLLAAAFGRSAGVDTDEANAARLLHLPSALAMVVVFSLTVGVCVWLVTRLPRGRRATTVAAVAVGAVTGFALFRSLA